MEASEPTGAAIPVPSGPVTWPAVNDLIQLAIAMAFGPETIQALARAMSEKVDGDTRIQLYHPAQVIADLSDGSTRRASVHMDGDDQGVVTYCGILSPGVLVPGQQVMVWFDKPHVAYVVASPPGVPLARGAFCYGGGVG